jgi:hypothetical protein
MMVKSIVFAAALWSSKAFTQAIQEHKINAPIKKVKLYFTSGEMQHESDAKLTKGRNKIVFKGISSYAFSESIQFYADGKYRLVSVSTEMDFLAGEQNNPRIVALKDSVDKLTFGLTSLNDQLDAFQNEKGLLMANQNIKGDNQNLPVAQLKEMADFYRIRMLDINQNISRLTHVTNERSVKIGEYRRQLLELNFNENNRSNQVIVLLDVEETSNAKLKLNYIVSECGWAALYDLRAEDVNQKINLKYKAQVYNNTGNAWNNVDLVLSTADPMLNATAPKLEAWYLNYSEYSKTSNTMAYNMQQSNVQMDQLNSQNRRLYDEFNYNGRLSKNGEGKYERNDNFETTIIAEDDMQNVFQKKVQMRSIEVSELSTEFNIAYVFSCPNDAKPYVVDVKDFALDARFSYVSTPKLSTGAYLLANITGWQDLSLVPGPTHVYFGGKYVGQSMLDTKSVDDTLSLSLGRDEKITVMRKSKEEMTTKKTVGSNKKELYTYDIILRNNRSTAITINVFDQVPVSRHSEITVSVENISGAKKNEDTGELEWLVTLAPNETKSMELSYEVRYPKNASIKLKTYRTISAPSF